MKSAHFAALAIAMSATVAAAAPRASHIVVAQAWSRPAVAGANGAGYLTIMNHGPAPVILVRVESPLAQRVEMHRSSMAGGVMSMAPAARVAVPGKGSVSFAPGGYHLMLIGLKRSLAAGDTIPGTLVFADGARAPVTFKVGDPPGAAAGDPMAGMAHR